MSEELTKENIIYLIDNAKDNMFIRNILGKLGIDPFKENANKPREDIEVGDILSNNCACTTLDLFTSKLDKLVIPQIGDKVRLIDEPSRIFEITSEIENGWTSEDNNCWALNEIEIITEEMEEE